MKLHIELVPKPTWHINARSTLLREQWDIVRHETYAKYGHQCGICGTQGRLHCHEIWEYDDDKHIQKLVGLIALCPACHGIKHIGRTRVMARQGKADWQKVRKHFTTVNNCSKDDFIKAIDDAFGIWKKRSKHEWQVDMSILVKGRK